MYIQKQRYVNILGIDKYFKHYAQCNLMKKKAISDYLLIFWIQNTILVLTFSPGNVGFHFCLWKYRFSKDLGF